MSTAVEPVEPVETPTTRRTWLRAVAALVVALSILGAVLMALGQPVGPLPLLWLPTGFILIGWGITWMARRSASQLLTGASAKPAPLVGRRLLATRAGWLVLFGATALVYAVGIVSVWRQAKGVYTPGEWEEFMGDGFLGLTYQERLTIGGTVNDTPGWYVWLVVVRQSLVFVAALAIAWSIFVRKPHHWMAYLVGAVVVFGPLLSVARDSTLFSATWVDDLVGWLGIPAGVGVMGFLWMFPDGRFLGTYLRYLGLSIAVLVPLLLFQNSDPTWWVLVTCFVMLVTGGIATQVWRYRHAPLSSKALARRNLAVLVAIPVWAVAYEWVYQRFDRDEFASSEGRRLFVFAWHQFHLTVYLVFPVLLGLWVLYLMRNQGWWDAQRFWNRAAVFGILTPVLVAGYVGILVAVTAVTEGLSGAAHRPVAVLAATAAAAFAYRPAQRRATRWVDRRFFPSRAMADATVASFTGRIRQEADDVVVRDQLLDVVNRVFRPEHATGWLAGSERRP
jgi:hypothetical protein